MMRKMLKEGLKLGGVSLVEIEGKKVGNDLTEEGKKVEKDLVGSRVEEKKVTEGKGEEKEKSTRGRSVMLKLSNSLNSLRAENKGKEEDKKRSGERGVTKLWEELGNSIEVKNSVELKRDLELKLREVEVLQAKLREREEKEKDLIEERLTENFKEVLLVEDSEEGEMVEEKKRIWGEDPEDGEVLDKEEDGEVKGSDVEVTEGEEEREVLQEMEED